MHIKDIKDIKDIKVTKLPIEPPISSSESPETHTICARSSPSGSLQPESDHQGMGQSHGVPRLRRPKVLMFAFD